MAVDPWQEFRKSATDDTDVWSEFRQPAASGEEDVKIANDLKGGTPTTPYQLQKPQTYTSGMQYRLGGNPTRSTENYTPQQVEAAKQGVNVDANAGVDTFQANFAANKEKHDNLVSQLIKAKYGEDTQVRTGTEAPSGDVEYFDKDAQQWKTAGDSPMGHVPGAIPGTFETIGAIAGSFLPVPAVSTALGAGIGRATGQGVKNVVGRSLGLNNDDQRDDPNPYNEGLKSTAENLAINAVTSGVPAGWRMMTKGKDIVTAPVAENILASYNKNITMVDQINQALAGQTDRRMTMSTARVAAMPDSNTGMINTDAANLAAREPLLLRSPAMADRERERRLNNQNVIELYWTNEVSNPNAVPNITQDNWQARLKQYYDNYKDGVLGPYQNAADQAVQAAEQTAKQQNKVGDINLAKKGQLVRDQITKASEASKAQESAAWADYGQEAQYVPDRMGSKLKVPVTPKVMMTIKTMDDITKKALLDSQKGQATKYLLNLDPGVPFKDQTMDLAMLDRTIKDLRKEGSQSMRGQAGPDISDANRNRLMASLVDARVKFMKTQSPELQTALASAEAETARHHAEFDRSFVGSFLQHDDAYNLHIADPAVLDQIMRNKDITGAKQLAGIVAGAPGAKKGITDYIQAYYNSKYTKLQADGTRIIDPKGHTRFVEQVLPTLKPFLSPAEMAEYRQIGGIGKAVVKATDNYNAAVDAWKATDSGKLGLRLNTETFINQFYDPKKSFAMTNLAFIKKRLGNDALEKTRAGIMADMVSKATVNGRLDVDKLSGVVAPIQDRMRAYFGSKTVDNMNLAIKTTQAAQRDFLVSAPSPNGTTFLSEGSKMILGPLSSENRKISFLKGLRVKSEAARLEAALYDPNELPRLIEEINSRQGRTAMKSVAGAVTLASFDQ